MIHINTVHAILALFLHLHNREDSETLELDGAARQKEPGSLNDCLEQGTPT